MTPAQPAPSTDPGTNWTAGRDEYGWTVVAANGDLVARVPGSDAYAQGQAEYIARACNSFGPLVEALEALLSFNGHYDGCYGGPPYNRICEPVCAQARSALKLAKGGQS